MSPEKLELTFWILGLALEAEETGEAGRAAPLGAEQNVRTAGAVEFEDEGEFS